GHTDISISGGHVSRAICDCVTGPQKRPAITSTARGLSKWKHQFFPRARRRGRAIFWFLVESRPENFTRCHKRHNNTNNCSWSRAWRNIFRSRDVFATKICAPTGNRSLRRSISKRRSSRRTTFSRLPKECWQQFLKRRSTPKSKRLLIAFLIARRLADTAAINPIAVLEWSLSISEKFFARAVSRSFVARSMQAAW